MGVGTASMAGGFAGRHCVGARQGCTGSQPEPMHRPIAPHLALGVLGLYHLICEKGAAISQAGNGLRGEQFECQPTRVPPAGSSCRCPPPAGGGGTLCAAAASRPRRALWSLCLQHAGSAMLGLQPHCAPFLLSSSTALKCGSVASISNVFSRYALSSARGQPSKSSADRWWRAVRGLSCSTVLSRLPAARHERDCGQIETMGVEGSGCMPGSGMPCQCRCHASHQARSLLLLLCWALRR